MIMKYPLLFLCLLISSLSFGQSLLGAWEATFEADGTTQRSVVIFAEGYQVATFYEADTGAFISTNGGSWSLEGNQLTETVEFDTDTPDRVGSTSVFEIHIDGDRLTANGYDQVWKRIDAGNPGVLMGAWLISGRMRDGTLQKRNTDRPRKTMKILSGTRFQWIAYNTETKELWVPEGAPTPPLMVNTPSISNSFQGTMPGSVPNWNSISSSRKAIGTIQA